MSDLGEVTRCFSLRFDRRLDHSPARVWSAITDPQEASKWMHPFPVKIDLRVGGHWEAWFEGADVPWCPGVIVRLEPERLLAYVWDYSIVEWRLEPDGAGCRYTYRIHGTPEPPPGADWTQESAAAGWHEGVDRFAAYLDGVGVDAAQQQSWAGLVPAYRARIEAVRSAP